MATHWQQPNEGRRTGLTIANSLTGANDEFIPREGNSVSWYICGPTVYDSSHFGHARNYMTFDIIRRIMVDYFRYDVFFVMNITDIDDKIIIKAHQRHLEDLYKFISQQETASSFVTSDEGKEVMKRAKTLFETKNSPIVEVTSVAAELKEKVSATGELMCTIMSIIAQLTHVRLIRYNFTRRTRSCFQYSRRLSTTREVLRKRVF